MTARRLTTLLCAAGLVLAAAAFGPASAAKRVALVVGNGNYAAKNLSALRNPVSDAGLMARTLETLGFEVQLVTDADQTAMKAAIEAFGKRLKAAKGDSVGLFYYAGHGVEAGGRNYLIPVGAQIESAVEFEIDAVPARWVLAWMEAAKNRLNMVILDACRNNPFGGLHRGGNTGLARMDAPSGSLIAYAAAPGKLAEDGDGKNSPYTTALAATMIEPGLKVEDIFKRVRVKVEKATGGKQTPWESSSLRGDFYFAARSVEPDTPKPPAKKVTTTVTQNKTALQLAARAYEAAERTDTIAGYRLIVEQFPGTVYAGLARERIAKLEEAAKPSTEEVEEALRLRLAERKKIQIGLWALGNNPGVPDGVFGARTRDAIRRWQKSQGKPATGFLDAGAAKSLRAAVPDLTRPMWLTAKNQPCKVWNPAPKPGETVDWSGSCTDGKASGSGRLIWRGSYGTTTYTGQFRGGREHGHGTFVWQSGNRYKGQWRNGKRHGRGTFRWKDGATYRGSWRQNKPHGYGALKWANGRITKGNWNKGCFGKRGGRWTTAFTSSKACGFK